MAKTESTAVNALIDLVKTQKPVPADPSEDLMFAAPRKGSPRVTSTEMLGRDIEPLPRGRVGLGTQTNLPPAVRMGAQPVRTLTIPPLTQRATGELPLATRETRPSLPPPIRSRSQGTPAPELYSRNGTTLPMSNRPIYPGTRSLVHATVAPASMPVAAPFESTPAPALDMTSNQLWFDGGPSDAVEAALAESHSEGTLQLQKTTGTLGLIGQLIMPMLLLVIVGVFVGGYIAFDGEGGKPSSKVAGAGALPVEDGKPAPAVQAAPVAPTAATVQPALTAPLPTAPAFVDVRIDSKPSGATVMLVDRGKTTFLGTTPISTAVDPSRTYDIVFTYEDRPTQLEHLDATATTHLEVVLGKPGRVARVATTNVAITPAPVETAVAKPVVVVAPKAAPLTKPVAKVRVDLEPAVKRAVAASAGVLMLSSKPPCEIYVDGKPTGLMTPQRAISLSAGAHTITLVSPDKSIKKTFAVQIATDKPTKVIQDLMKP